MLESRMSEEGNTVFVDSGTGTSYKTHAEGLEAIEKREQEFADANGKPEDALERLLTKVDLNDPIEVKDSAGRPVSVTKEQFIEHYMPDNATQSEKFHCFQAVKATGLSMLVPGECYFFKTGDGPIQLFTGYKAYLRKAYAGELEHIEKPELIYDEEGGKLPVSCIITLRMKGDREDFVWETWFSEVVGEKNGQPNARWRKAPRQMFIKCSVVNTLRMSGLVDFTLPYIIEEMGDPVADGYRTLTQEQLDAHPEEGEEIPMEIGSVNAATHQVDTSRMRVNYHTTLGELNIFESDDQRRKWQEEIIGAASSASWGVDEYLQAMREIATGKLAVWVENQKPDPDTPGGSDENAPESDTDEADGAETPQAEEEQQDDAVTPAQTDDPEEPEKEFLTNATHEEIKACLLLFPDRRYLKVGSTLFRQRAYGIIEHKYNSIRSILETEGQLIVAELRTELAKAESEAVDDAADEAADRAAWGTDERRGMT